ncbi:hypothetical protein RF11_10336 [Thelohanellus kitauei]|uniref:Uncharacterized protein n=1 Tax=Thelohanellus kitauei TaxID=669202 RepID=A0A0C2J6L1_THEKT|nr:hypothetical protein RF11_10336 [Thelohanellus kitauei]
MGSSLICCPFKEFNRMPKLLILISNPVACLFLAWLVKGHSIERFTGHSNSSVIAYKKFLRQFVSDIFDFIDLKTKEPGIFYTHQIVKHGESFMESLTGGHINTNEGTCNY